MLSKPIAWLVAGSAVALCASVAVAAVDAPSKDAERVTQEVRKDVRVYRDDDGKERREVRVYRGGRDRDVYVFRGGDRAEHLRTMLQLRPDQDGALKAYLAAVADKGEREQIVRMDRRTDVTRTTPERLAEMEAKLATQQAAMRMRIDATKTFYGQLDASQKKVFDAMPMLMFAGPGLGPMLLPVGMPMPPEPPAPPRPPRL